MIGRSIKTVTFSNATTVDVDTSADIADARQAIPCLYDSGNNISLLEITALSASTFRVTSETAITAVFTLIVLGEPASTPGPNTAVTQGPTVSRFWTYAQARQKLEVDLDLLDETFVTPNELIGYFNEGIEEAESEILKIDEDYFLTSQAFPLITGQSAYAYPDNIYAFKIRGLVYSNNNIIYNVKRFRRKNKFENFAFANQYSAADDYRWWHKNDAAGGATINLIPPSRETAVVPPNPSSFTPMTLWYIRHMNRVPLLGAYVNDWDLLVSETAVDPLADRMTITNAYVTGDTVKLTTTGTLPGGLTLNTVYYVISITGGYIKLATTLQNALAGTAINLTSSGSGILSVAIAANQSIVDNTLIDLPEFMKFIIQWAKCRCQNKEIDPRLGPEAELLKQQRQQMVDTLTEMQPDDENEMEQDLSSYTEMS